MAQNVQSEWTYIPGQLHNIKHFTSGTDGSLTPECVSCVVLGC